MRPRAHNLTFVSALVMAAFTAVGCTHDPCRGATVETDHPGAATLTLQVTERIGLVSTRDRPLECVDVLVFPAGDYTDTLAAGRFLIERGTLRIPNLQESTVDIIIDQAGYIPSKIADVDVEAGENRITDRVLMFRSDTPMAQLGQIGIMMKPGRSFEPVGRYYGLIDGVTVGQANDSLFVIAIPVHDRVLARRRVENISRELVMWPDVQVARPVAIVVSRR